MFFLTFVMYEHIKVDIYMNIHIMREIWEYKKPDNKLNVNFNTSYINVFPRDRTINFASFSWRLVANGSVEIYWRWQNNVSSSNIYCGILMTNCTEMKRFQNISRYSYFEYVILLITKYTVTERDRYYSFNNATRYHYQLPFRDSHFQL